MQRPRHGLGSPRREKAHGALLCGTRTRTRTRVIHVHPVHSACLCTFFFELLDLLPHLRVPASAASIVASGASPAGWCPTRTSLCSRRKARLCGTTHIKRTGAEAHIRTQARTHASTRQPQARDRRADIYSRRSTHANARTHARTHARTSTRARVPPPTPCQGPLSSILAGVHRAAPSAQRRGRTSA